MAWCEALLTDRGSGTKSLFHILNPAFVGVVLSEFQSKLAFWSSWPNQLVLVACRDKSRWHRQNDSAGVVDCSCYHGKLIVQQLITRKKSGITGITTGMVCSRAVTIQGRIQATDTLFVKW